MNEIKEQLLELMDAFNGEVSDEDIFNPLCVEIHELLEDLLSLPVFDNMKLTDFVQFTNLERREFYTFLTERKIIRREYDTGNFIAYDKYLLKGYFVVKEKRYIEDKKMKFYTITLITPEGRQWMKETFPEIFN